MRSFRWRAHSLTIPYFAGASDKTWQKTQNVSHIRLVILTLVEAGIACGLSISFSTVSKKSKSFMWCLFCWITYYGEEKFGISSRYIPKIDSTAIFSGVFQNDWIDVNECSVLSKGGSLAEIFPVRPVGRRLFDIPGIIAGQT